MYKGRDIDEIIFASFNRQGSKEELEILDEWLNSSNENLELYRYLELVWKEKSAKRRVPNSQEVLDKIWTEATGESTKSSYDNWNANTWKRYVSIAAAVVLLITSSVIAYRIQLQDKVDTPLGELVTKQTLEGQKLQITLPDSSIVWINSGSTIEYRENFTTTCREVRLRGEAYFEVKKDPSRTFEVVTDDLVVRALGTSFNVNAADSKVETKVALVEGKVELEDSDSLTVFLDAGQLGTYNSRDKKFEKTRTSLAKEIAWKDWIIYFKNSDEKEVLRVLEKWYGVEIEVLNSSPREWEITAEYDNLSLSNVLKSLSYAANFEYKIKENKVSIKY